MSKASKIISIIAISAVLSTALLCGLTGIIYCAVSEFSAVAAVLKEHGVGKEDLVDSINGIKQLIVFTDGKIDMEKASAAVYDVYENTDSEVLAKSCYAYFHPAKSPKKELAAVAYYNEKSVKSALKELNSVVKERFGSTSKGDLFKLLSSLELEEWRLLFAAVNSRAVYLANLTDFGQSMVDFALKFIKAEDKSAFFSAMPMTALYKEIRRLAAFVEPKVEEINLLEKLADATFNKGFAPVLQGMCRTLNDIGSADFLTVGINLKRDTVHGFAALLKIVFKSGKIDRIRLNDSLCMLSGVNCDFNVITGKSYLVRTEEEHAALKNALSGFIDNIYLLI